jgi:hypothetical protein
MRKIAVAALLMAIAVSLVVLGESGNSSTSQTKTTTQAQNPEKSKSSIRRLPSLRQHKVKGHIPNVNAYWWIEFEEGPPSSEVRVFTKKGTALNSNALHFVTNGENVNLKLGPKAQLLEVTAFYNTGKESADFYEEVRHWNSHSIPLARIVTVAHGKQHELRLTQLAVQAFDPRFPVHHHPKPGIALPEADVT